MRKKVLWDLFGSPATVLPVAAGLTAWILSWATGGIGWLNWVGGAGLLAGLGILSARLFFGLEKIVENAYAYVNEQHRQQRESALDALNRKLRQDRDSRTQKLLREMRHLYTSFQNDAKQGRITGSTHPILEKVDRLFDSAVQHLEHTYRLYRTAKRATGDTRETLLKEREEVVQEVEETVEHLGRAINQFHSFKLRESESELEKLREELDETMRVARRTEERVAALGRQTDYDPAEFE